jgi:hypothetical protein
MVQSSKYMYFVKHTQLILELFFVIDGTSAAIVNFLS